MAKSTVPVNFKDDIMNSSMGGKRRYKIINNSDGTISLEDATTYDQVGSNFGAAQMNATNQAVNAAADAGKIIDDIETIRNVTEEGYIAGALALKKVGDSLNKILEDGLMKKIMFTKLYLTEVSNTNNPTFTIENLNIGDIILFLAYGYSTNFSSITGGHIITLFNEDEPLYFIIEATDTTVVVNGYKCNTASPLTFVSAYKIEDVNVVDE